MKRKAWFVVAALALLSGGAIADDTFTVAPTVIADEKAVFATVQSVNVAEARARIGGTVARLTVREGDRVTQGQVLASVGDEKIALQIRSLDAQIAGLDAALAQAQTDLALAEKLFAGGTVPRARLDEARTAVTVATNAQRSRVAERSVVAQQLVEGNVLAPAAGRVLKVPVRAGAVVMAGEPIALIADKDFVVRLEVPERHARFLKAGDPVRIDGEELGEADPRFGTIRLVYPQIEDGRVTVDAVVAGLGDYFVGARIRVWVLAGEHSAFVVPVRFVATRFGVDYVRLQQQGGAVADVPVLRGRELAGADAAGGVEILSGVKPADRLVAP